MGGDIQNPTMIFRLGNVDIDAFLSFWGVDTISPDAVGDLMLRARAEKGYSLPRLKVWVYPTNRPHELFMNVTAITGLDGRSLNALDPEDHSEAERAARQQVRNMPHFLRNTFRDARTASWKISRQMWVSARPVPLSVLIA